MAGCYRFETDFSCRYRLLNHHLLLVENGRIRVRLPDESFTAQGGDLVCLRPGPRCEYATAGRPLHFQSAIEFAPPPRHHLTPWIDGIGKLPYRVSLGDRFGEMREAFETLCLNLDREGPQHYLAVQMAVLRILSLVARVEAPRNLLTPRLGDWQRVRLRLASELSGPVPIHQLAREMGVTTEHFCRRFKRQFHMSPKAFSNQMRMLHAVRLLREGRQSIKATALGLGFNAARSFSRNFKRALGTTPAHFRDGGHIPPQIQPKSGKRLFPMNRHILSVRHGFRWYRQAVQASQLQTVYQ